MLVLCNGVYKSGSTWLFTILRNYFEQGEFDELSRSSLNHFNLDLQKVLSGRVEFDPDEVVVMKTHCYDQRVMSKIKALRPTIVIGTTRSTAEILKSHYFHYERENNLTMSLSGYMLRVGFIKAVECEIYKNFLQDEEHTDFLFEFCQVKRTPEVLIREVCKLLGADINEERIKVAVENAVIRPGVSVAETTGMTNREWFGARSATTRDFSTAEQKICEASVAIARLVLLVPPLKTLLTALATWGRSKSR